MNTEFWKNQRVVITGGTSGLGKALALKLDQYGAKVAIIARNQVPLNQTVAGTSIYPIQADVSNKHDIHPISGEAIGVLGGIDFIFNNASYLGQTPLKLLMDTECEDLEQVLATNLVGPFRLSKALLPSMLMQEKGTVINISSDAAVSAYPQWGSYSISKAAIDHMSRIWHEELAEHGIRFFAIDPGDMHTPMHMDAIPDADPADLYNPADVADRLLAFLSRLSHPDQVRFSSQEWRQAAARIDSASQQRTP